jgi:hypothetical protein
VLPLPPTTGVNGPWCGVFIAPLAWVNGPRGDALELEQLAHEGLRGRRGAGRGGSGGGVLLVRLRHNKHLTRKAARRHLHSAAEVDVVGGAARVHAAGDGAQVHLRVHQQRMKKESVSFWFFGYLHTTKKTSSVTSLLLSA